MRRSKEETVIETREKKLLRERERAEENANENYIFLSFFFSILVMVTPSHSSIDSSRWCMWDKERCIGKEGVIATDGFLYV